MKFLVVQPHLDDAFFSLTETAMTWREDGHEVHLLTVFSAVPPEGNERHIKHVTMWQEYEAAIERGPFEHYRALDYFDDAVRVGQLMWEPFEDDVNYAVKHYRADAVVAPTGISHPDHRLVRAAIDDWNPDGKTWYYDELPYYVAYPQWSWSAKWLSLLGSGYPRPYEREGCREHLAAKKRLCRLFGSQVGDTEERCLWVPERVWRPM